MWSAFKYACRWASKLEYQELATNFERLNEWEQEYDRQNRTRYLDTVSGVGRRGVGYRGGNGTK